MEEDNNLLMLNLSGVLMKRAKQNHQPDAIQVLKQNLTPFQMKMYLQTRASIQGSKSSQKKWPHIHNSYVNLAMSNLRVEVLLAKYLSREQHATYLAVKKQFFKAPNATPERWNVLKNIYISTAKLNRETRRVKKGFGIPASKQKPKHRVRKGAGIPANKDTRHDKENRVRKNHTPHNKTRAKASILQTHSTNQLPLWLTRTPLSPD